MCDNGNEMSQETDQNAKKESISYGCLIWPYLLIQLPGVILWLVWLFQGCQDNWYGKIFRFQWKTSLILLAMVIDCTIVYTGTGRIKKKKEIEKTENEEKW